jgi:hypothetical protein
MIDTYERVYLPEEMKEFLPKARWTPSAEPGMIRVRISRETIKALKAIQSNDETFTTTCCRILREMAEQYGVDFIKGLE